MLALPFVPMVSPPPSSRPRPSTRIRPSTFTSALKAEITQIWPAGLTRRTMFRTTLGKVPSGLAVPATFATGISPMAPWNLTNVSSAITDEAKNPPIRTIRIDATKLFFMTAPPFLFFYFLRVEREISVKEVADLSIKDQVHHLGMKRSRWRSRAAVADL